MQPNSELIFLEINYRFTNRLTLTTEFTYSNHGANIINNDGSIKNVGGNLQLGHRANDSDNVNFLDGNLEVFKSITVNVSYEPINQILLFLNTSFNSNTSDISNSKKDYQLFLGTRLKF
jgi:hypothetical protein